MLQIHGDRSAAPAHRAQQRIGHTAGPGSIDTHYVGAELGEEHRCERNRADAGKFDDTEIVEGTHWRRG
jgi:hypothetical protein